MPINPKTFIPRESRWGDIFKHLESNGIYVQSPTQHVGRIIKPTVIILFSGAAQHGGLYGMGGVSTDDYRYTLDICVPEENYSILENFVVKVRECMKGLYPMIIDERNVSTAFYDDSIKAHYVECTYINHRKYDNF